MSTHTKPCMLSSGAHILRAFIVVLFALFIFALFSASAEAEDAKDMRRITSQWQTLQWSAADDEGVLFYEVVVESLESDKDGARFTEAARIKAKSTEHSVKIDPLLKAGVYRYKVNTYNLLGIKASQSDWEVFSIVEAKQPVIRSVETQSGGNVIHLDKNQSGILLIKGHNLFTSNDKDGALSFTRYSLVRADTKESIDVIVTEADGYMAVGTVDIECLREGKYYLTAADASGLESKTQSAVLLADTGRSNDYCISVCYMPSFVLCDTEGSLSTAQPLGAAAQAIAISSKDEVLYFGAGVKAMYNRINLSGGDSGNLINAQVMLVWQKSLLRRKNIIECYLGMGVASWSGMDRYKESIFPALSGGAAMQCALFKNVYAYLGGECVLTMMKDNRHDTAIKALLSPKIGITYRFAKG